MIDPGVFGPALIIPGSAHTFGHKLSPRFAPNDNTRDGAAPKLGMAPEYSRPNVGKQVERKGKRLGLWRIPSRLSLDSEAGELGSESMPWVYALTAS
jgi:hypothetical protein